MIDNQKKVLNGTVGKFYRRVLTEVSPTLAQAMIYSSLIEKSVTTIAKLKNSFKEQVFHKKPMSHHGKSLRQSWFIITRLNNSSNKSLNELTPILVIIKDKIFITLALNPNIVVKSAA